MRQTGLALLALALAGCGMPSGMTTSGRWISTPEIRVYADRGIILPGGEKGGAVQVYGVQVESNGSEKVVWKHLLHQFHGLKFPYEYYVIVLDGHAYLRFAHYRRHRYFKFSRRTGELAGTVEPSDGEYAKLQAISGVKRMLVPRPDIHVGRPQTTRRTVTTKLRLRERETGIIEDLRERAGRHNTRVQPDAASRGGGHDD